MLPKSENSYSRVKKKAVIASDINKGEESDSPDKEIENIATEVVEAIAALTEIAEEVDNNKIDDKELPKRLAYVMKKLKTKKELERKKAIRRGRKKKKTLLEEIASKIIKAFAIKSHKTKLNNYTLEKKKFTESLMEDLNSTVMQLNTASRLDSDINDIRLIEDVLSVNQRMSDLLRKMPTAAKGLSQALFKAFTSAGSISGNKNLAALSALKVGVATESFVDASSIKFDAVAGEVDAHSTKDARQQGIIEKLSKGGKVFGPTDIPITSEARARNQARDSEFMAYKPPK